MAIALEKLSHETWKRIVDTYESEASLEDLWFTIIITKKTMYCIGKRICCFI
jgi:hypothetical protein